MPSQGTGAPPQAVIAATAKDRAGNEKSTSVSVTLTTTLKLSCQPIFNEVAVGGAAAFTATLENKSGSPVDVQLDVIPLGVVPPPPGVPAWNVKTVPSPPPADFFSFSLPPGAKITRNLTVKNEGSEGSLILRLNATTASGLSKACEALFKTPNAPNPQNWPTPPSENPDDTQDVSSVLYPSVFRYDTDSPIGILFSGWGEGVGHILGKFNIPACLISPTDFHVIGNPDRFLEHTRVLIIGSGGLWGFSSVPSIRERLRGFVEAGGTIITLTPHVGSELLALPPENGTRGFGWTEDQSCFSQAAYIENEHPVFAGQSVNLLDASVDGYIDFFPSEGNVLLRRRTNGQAVLVEYPFGQGRIIASALYSDFGYGRGQASASEFELF